MLPCGCRIRIFHNMRHPTQLHSGDIDWSRVRLLVFSLDDGFAFLVRQTFRKLRVGGVTCTSLAGDTACLDEARPDVTLIDLDGEEELALRFLQAARQSGADMPVLLVARPANRGLMDKAAPWGVAGFVPKPVSGHELLHRVAEALKAPRVKLAAPPSPRGPAHTAPHHRPAHHGPARRSPPPLTHSGPTLAKEPHPPSATTAAPAPPSPMAENGKGGTYDVAGLAAGEKKAGGFDDADVLADPAKKRKLRREMLADALPSEIAPKRGDDDGAAERRRQQWLDELAAAGHTARTGADIGGLNVEAIVAAHVLWQSSRGGDGKRADFKGLDLAGGDLSGTMLANAGFRQVDLSDANLSAARLDGADFRHATLGAADLSEANMAVAQLRHADLRLANLEGTTLRGADLSGARLSGAKMSGADFSGATLVGTDLSGADLSKVDNLLQAQVDKARCDGETKLPPGLRRPGTEVD